jgi:hypothetical protein
MAVGAGDQCRGHVGSEQRNGGGVGTVGDGEYAAGSGVVLGESKRGGGAKTNPRQIDAVLRDEARDGPCEGAGLVSCSVPLPLKVTLPESDC